LERTGAGSQADLPCPLHMTTDDKPWYDEAKMRAVYALDKVKNDAEAAAVFQQAGYDVSRRAITDARNALGIPAKTKAEFIDIPQEAVSDAGYDRDKLWEIVTQLQTEMRKKNKSKKDVTVNLLESKPIGFFFMGDLHIGDVGTDHAALLRDVKLIQGTEGLYGTLGGDYINNFILGGKKIKNHEAVPVEFAWDLTEDIFGRLKDSLLTILLGNHDEWTDVAAEFDKVAEMVDRLGVPYGKHGTNVHVNFPDGQAYKIRLRHKYQFNSNQNLLNSVKQMYRWDEDFDIGALHHLHTPNFEMFTAQRGMCWALRPGSYKVEDDYSYALGFTKNGFGMSRSFGTEDSCHYSVPMAILYPGERRIQMMPSIRDGVDYLAYARDRWEKGDR
jgi:hypothetical protein